MLVFHQNKPDLHIENKLLN